MTFQPGDRVVMSPSSPFTSRPFDYGIVVTFDRPYYRVRWYSASGRLPSADGLYTGDELALSSMNLLTEDVADDV